MNFHFISGLPRSGSTLLASILCQNPHFHASVMTPLAQIVGGTLAAMGPHNEAAGFMDAYQKARMVRGLFTGYYDGVCKTVPDLYTTVFDNNRRWTTHAGLLAHLFPQSKIICMLRSPNAIVDSFERLFQKNPLDLSAIYGGHANLTVYARVAELMKPEGVVGYSYNAFRTAFFGPHADSLICISYDDLARTPEAVMAALYKDLGAEPFVHDFSNIKQIDGAAEYDRRLHTPGLHDLLPAVVYPPRRSVLPPDIWAGLPPAFWSKDAVTSAG